MSLKALILTLALMDCVGGVRVIRMLRGPVVMVATAPEQAAVSADAASVEDNVVVQGVVVPTTMQPPSVLPPPTTPTGWLKKLRGGYVTQKQKAADLIKRYGIAYLLCSISLSLCSFSLIYMLVSHGVDVPTLLGRVGISLGSRFEQLGTVGVAYALHKAASPIRFAPTVALTAMVAQRLEAARAGDANVRAASSGP